jgi:large subunit ribosomal protein L17
MRHRKSHSLLNRFTSWRKATLSSLARGILINQRIQTTKVKARSVKPLVEQLVSLAKKNDLAAKRKAFSILNDHQLVKLLFSDIGPRFKSRTGGYTRLVNLNRRRGDGAEMAILELTEIKEKEVKKPKSKSKEAVEGPTAQAPQQEAPSEEKKPRTETAVKEEKPPLTKKPSKKFLGGLRGIFKKERDSL